MSAAILPAFAVAFVAIELALPTPWFFEGAGAATALVGLAGFVAGAAWRDTARRHPALRPALSVVWPAALTLHVGFRVPDAPPLGGGLDYLVLWYAATAITGLGLGVLIGRLAESLRNDDRS